jgi:nucleotide-binding universal stress UspA family protein
MLPLKTILHATDFSDCSKAGFQLACSLAKDYKARLILVHVAPPMEVAHGAYYAAPPPPAKEIEELKKELFALKPTSSTIDVEYIFRRGDSAEQILDVAKNNACDAIVIGTHGRTGLTRLLMGSVAEKVVRQAECPVVTVKKPFDKKSAGNTASQMSAATMS